MAASSVARVPRHASLPASLPCSALGALQPAVRWRAYRGHQGVAEWLRDVDDSFSSAHIEPLELTDLGDRVLAITRFDVEGHESGVSFGPELGLVIGVDGGRIASWSAS
jgi:ketosteroid isomerase-like protein